MDNETKELNITTIAIVLLVLFFTYCAIPSHETEKSHYAKTAVAQSHEAAAPQEADSHEAEAKEDHAPAAVAQSHEAAPATAAETAPADQSAHAAAPAPETAAAPAEKNFDMIAMNNPGYAKHKKGIVMFSHKKHFDEYKISCGDCHHDDTGAPLDLKIGDEVESCIACHEGTKKPKGEKLPKDEAIMAYHFEALHANCIGCHKAFNIEKGDPKGKKPAPTSCKKCHPKNK